MLTQSDHSPVVPLDSQKITHPQSRHNIHVTRRSDIEPVDPWSRDELFAGVKRAADDGCVVVVDYGREQLWLADRDELTYVRPSQVGHGFGTHPGLLVGTPRLFEPASETVHRTRVQTRAVSPEFDILIPAFDWDELDESVLPPEVEFLERPTDSPAGTPNG